MIDMQKAVGGSGPELWVSGRSYAVGEQAISQTDFGVYIRKVAGAGTTNPASDAANWQPFGGRAIKSIQRGSTALSSGTVTISAVNTAKTELRLLTTSDSSIQTIAVTSASTSYPGAYQWMGDNIRLALASSTTISISGNSLSRQISWELTEYY